MTELDASHNMSINGTMDNTVSVINHDQDPEELLSQWCRRCIIAGEERLLKEQQTSLEGRNREWKDLLLAQEQARSAFFESQKSQRDDWQATKQREVDEEKLRWNKGCSQVRADILERLSKIDPTEIATRIMDIGLPTMELPVLDDEAPLVEPLLVDTSVRQPAHVDPPSGHDGQGLPTPEEDVILVSAQSKHPLEADDVNSEGPSNKRPKQSTVEEVKSDVVGTRTRPRIEKYRAANRSHQPRTVDKSVVGGTDFIFRLSENIDKWFVLLCGCRNFDKHPFRDSKGIRFHINRGKHTVPLLTEEYIMSVFGYEVVGEGLTESWVEEANGSIQLNKKNKKEKMIQDRKDRNGKRQQLSTASRRPAQSQAEDLEQPDNDSRMPEADMSLAENPMLLFTTEMFAAPGPMPFPDADGLPVFEDLTHDDPMF